MLKCSMPQNDNSFAAHSPLICATMEWGDGDDDDELHFTDKEIEVERDLVIGYVRACIWT